MKPKEKAEELFDKYFNQMRMPSDCEGCMQCVDRCNNMVYVAKKYALIAVDEIINVLNSDINPLVNYWYKVKEEIEKL